MIKSGIELITQERKEQIEKHGRTLTHDYEVNNQGQLAYAANLLSRDDLLLMPLPSDEKENVNYKDCCPIDWDQEIWEKMCNKSHQERLIIAAALCAAEYDRLTALIAFNEKEARKLKFLSEAFYEGSYNTVDMFNKLLENHENIRENSHYSNGAFLTFEVRKSDEVLETLREIITDIDQYEKYSDTIVNKSDKGVLDLSPLAYHVQDYFGYTDSIVWCKGAETDCFDLCGDPHED